MKRQRQAPPSATQATPPAVPPVAVRMLGACVRLFPPPFRHAFGAELHDHLARDYARARADGHGAVVWFTMAAAFDLVRAAAAERLRPTVVAAFTAPTSPPGDTMGSFPDWIRDLRHAVRTLGRSPGFAVITVATLAIAIGANAGMFSVVNRVLLDPLPFANADRLWGVYGTAPGSQLPAQFGLSDEFYVQYGEQSKLIDGVAQLSTGTSTMRVGDRVERVRMGFPTWNTFSLLGARPVLGRLPVASDESRVALISNGAWQTWFGGDSAVIGKEYFISGANRTVIGVLPDEFSFPVDGMLAWVPYTVNPAAITPGNFGSATIVRARPGATPEALASEMTTLAKRLPERFGGSAEYAKLIGQFHAGVAPLRDQILGPVAGALWVLFAAVGIVLIIACANVTNLFLVRSEGRHREMAVRQAIGASRGELMRLQIAESVVVAIAAGVVAVALAKIVLPVAVAIAPPGVPRMGTVHVDWRTLLFTAGTAMLAALACGLAPALRASRPDLSRLREGGRGATRKHRLARNALVVSQTALALVLLIGSGLLLRSHARLSNVDPGYSTKDLFTFQFAPQQQSLMDGDQWARFHLAFMERLKALPGVESVGIVDNVPLDEGTQLLPFRTEERASDVARTRLNSTIAGPGYFHTMGIKVLAGREFTTDDVLRNYGNAVISKSAANQLWPGEDPMGRRFRSSRDSSWNTVVGVVSDIAQDDMRDPLVATVYYPLRGPTPRSWRATSPGYVVKTTRASTIAPEIVALVHEVAPEAPVYRQYTMEFLARRSMSQLSFTMLTLGTAALLALILGAVGLYGVLSCIVAERTREIGVRMALGAEAAQVRRMVVVQGARVVGLGAVIGIVVALLSTRALGGLLYGVPAVDLPTFAGMSAAMVVVGLLASYMPARRASSVDPIESLRGE